MECLVTIGLLCLANATTINVSAPSSMYRTAEIMIGSAKVKTVLRSDSLSEFDPRRMNQACRDGTCILYYKHCERSLNEIACSYTLRNNPYANVLSLSAPDEAAFRLAEQSIGVIDPSSKNATKVPLSSLAIVSSEPHPPHCRRGGRGPQCPDANVR